MQCTGVQTHKDHEKSIRYVFRLFQQVIHLVEGKMRLVHWQLLAGDARPTARIVVSSVLAGGLLTHETENPMNA